ncbi:MAG: 2-C-methyl-D-erythritol 4-phosphate cytidylyltransferase [Bacteroidales bacterium]|nr:2-C-methyl-D-erythritol 4-phosphate cytidylyltransferase [Bacteroidales bacterium]
MNIAGILAGGTGSRMTADMPKQFIDLCGKTVLERTLDVFESHPDIHRVLVVSHPEYMEQTERIRKSGAYEKWDVTVPGGQERHLSSYAAVRACDGLEGHLLIHDAARPMVSHALIDRLLEALREAEAAAPVVPLRDTLIEASGEYIKSVPERKKFRNVQTPQAFRLSLLRNAFLQAINDSNICFTDDCSVILHYLPQTKIKMVEGEEQNQKLTYYSDIELFKKYFQKI